MPTTVRSSSTANGTTSPSSCSSPTGLAAGDLLLALVNCNGNTQVVTDNNGATPMTKDAAVNSTTAEGAATLTLFSRRIVAGDPATWSFAIAPTSARLTIVLVAFQNPHASVIYDVAAVSNHGGPTNLMTALGITTLNAGAIHCVVFGGDSLANAMSALPAGYTVEQNVGSQRIAFVDKVIAAPGATGNQTASQAAADSWDTFSFAIRTLGGSTFTGSSSVALTDTRVTAGTRKTFGVSAVALADGIVTAGIRKTFGVSLTALVDAITTAGKLSARASSQVALSDQVTTAGTRKTFSSSAVALVDTITTAGIRRLLSSSIVALTDTITTTGTRKALASSLVALTDAITTTGKLSARAASSTALTALVTTTGTRRALAASSTALSVVITTAGIVTSTLVKRWTGAAWVTATVRRWDGSAWQTAILKRRTPTSWQ